MKKYTIVDYFGYDLSPIERMRAISEAGFDGVILLWADYFDADYRRFPEYADKYGLFVENTHAPYRGANSLWKDTLIGAAYTESLIGCIEDCAAYGIPTMAVHPANGKFEIPDITVGIERMKQITEAAEKHGVNVALENMECPQFLSYIFARIDSPRIGFCYDSGHHNHYTKNLDLLGMYGDRLMALHLHDNDGNADSHRIPREGNINWKDLADRLNALGYEGCVSLEAQNGGFEHITDPVEFLRIALERAKTVMP